MFDLRSFVYSMGPVGMSYEYFQTGKIRPDPVGIAAWQLLNAGAMYTGTRFLTGEGQTMLSVYRPVVQDELANVRSIIRGSPKKPPMGVFATLAIGVDTLRMVDDVFSITEVPLDQQYY